MCDIEPSKLKVVELRAELQARGLDARGNKAVLIQRLEEALEAEKRDNGKKTLDVVTDNCVAESELPEDNSNASATDADDVKDTSGDHDVSEKEQEVLVQIPIEDQLTSNKEPEVETEIETAAHSTEDNVQTIEEREGEISSGGQPTTDKGENMSVRTDFHQNFNQPFIKQEIKQENESFVDSTSQRGEKRKWTEGEERTTPTIKQEPADEDKRVVLDSYNSDLNLTLSPNGCSALPMSREGFAFMWAGARATFGIKSGKVCFEVKVIKHLDVAHLPEDELNPHVVRVGFSCDEVSLLLGEENLSWGYGGTGKASTNLKFKDYGVPFAEGDVVTSFLDMSSNKIDVSFAKNGRHLGSAYNFPRSVIGDKALFPHVLTKNCEFELNFGQQETPYFPVPSSHQDYSFIDCVPIDQRVRGTVGPKRKDECEMVMMCGLPGSGKTTWANEYCAKHPHLKYNILGTNNIIDKMKVMGLPRKRNYHGRWEVLIQMSTKCLNTMMGIGAKLCRNFILDQTNVYPSAQRRKMRSFEGFKRRAVVVVPSDDEFKNRIEKREREEGKDVPDSAVLEMKANFGLPDVGPLFDDVEFTELQREEAEVLVKKYNEEGLAATGSRRRFNQDNKGRWEPADQMKPPSSGGEFRGSSRDGDFRGSPRDGDYRGSPRDDFRGSSRDGDHFRGRMGGGDSYRGSRGGNSFRGGRGGDMRSRNPDDQWQNPRWERDSPGGRGGGWRGGGGRGGDRGGDRGGWAPRRGGRPGMGDRGGRDGGWNRPPRDGGRGGFQDRGGGGGGYNRGGGGYSPGGRGSFNNRGGGRGGPPPRGGGRGYNSGSPNTGQGTYQGWDSSSSNQSYGQGNYQQYGGQWKSDQNSDASWKQADGAGGQWKQDATTGQWKQDTSTVSAYSQSYGQSYGAATGTATTAATDYTQQSTTPYAQTYTYTQQPATAYGTQGQYAQTATQYGQQTPVQQYTTQTAATSQYAQTPATQQYAAQTAAAQQQYTAAQQQWAQAYQQQGYQNYAQYGYTTQ